MPHLPSDLYRLVLAGHLPPRTLARALHRHLLEVCDRCAREWRAAAPRLAEARPSAAVAGAASGASSGKELEGAAGRARTW